LLIVMKVFIDESEAIFVPLLRAFSFSQLGLVASLLSLQPVAQFLAEPSLLVMEHLVVALLTTHLPLVIFVLIGEGVVDKHILTVDDRHSNSPLTVVVVMPARVLVRLAVSV